MNQTNLVRRNPASSKAVSWAPVPTPTAAPLVKHRVVNLCTINPVRDLRVSLDKSPTLDDQSKSHQNEARSNSLNGEKFDKKKVEHGQMDNQLNHGPTPAIKYMEDALITAKITALLMDVYVETQQGVVLLSGWVTRPHQLGQAERIALGVEGVKNVNNGLQVKRQTQWSASNRAGAPTAHRFKYE